MHKIDYTMCNHIVASKKYKKLLLEFKKRGD